MPSAKGWMGSRLRYSHGGWGSALDNVEWERRPWFSSPDALNGGPQGNGHGPSLEMCRSSTKLSRLELTWLKVNGHIPTGKLIMACWRHPGVPVQSLRIGEATSDHRAWSDRPWCSHTAVPSVPMAPTEVSSRRRDPGDPPSL